MRRGAYTAEARNARYTPPVARPRAVVTAVVAALAGASGSAWADPPRVAVLPLVVAGDDADARALRAAFLAQAARQPIAMTSVFDVEDALAGTAPGACAADDKCLTRLCAGTRSPYALSAVVSREEGRYQLAARVVSAQGSVVRQVELASTDAGAAATPVLALDQLFERLSLATIEEAPRAADAPAKAEGGLKTEEEKTLYALGALLGRNVAEFSLTPAEVKSVQLGLKDAALGKAPQVDLQAYSMKVNLLAQARRAVKAEGEKTRSKAFLDKAAKEKGAQALPSGLLYSELKPGSGESPKASDKVKVHYHGTLTDGKVFDSSVQRNQPAEFPLNQVIPCWTEGVQKMKVGGKSKLVCPSSIAYGDRGFPPDIPGGATLVFEVELLEILK